MGEGPAQVPTRPVSATTLYVSPMAFRFAWLVVMAMHGLLGAYYYFYGKFHMFLDEPKNQITNVLSDTIGLKIQPFLKPVYRVSFAIVACNAYAVLSCVLWSLRNRELCFGPVRSTRPVGPATIVPKGRSERCGLVRRVVGTVQDAFELVLGREGLLGIDFRYAPEVLLALEITEVTWQMVQAYRLSYYIPDVWVNRAIVIATFTNAFSVPVFHWIFHRRIALATVVVMGVDFVLAIVNSIGITTAVVYPYYRDHVDDWRRFSIGDFYVESWFNGARPRVQQVFTYSWGTLFCNVYPGFFVLGYLGTIKTCVIRQNERADQQIAPVVGTAQSKYLVGKSASAPAPRKEHRLVKAGRIFLGLVGCFVLITHIRTSVLAYNPAYKGCLFETRPWFQPKYTCQVLEISCTQQNIQGTKHELESLLSNVDARAPEILIFSHCPGLEMPESIRDYSGVQLLKLYNNSISSWETSSALAADTHPNLRSLYILDSNMSEIPPGVRGPEFPTETLVDIKIAGTNLTTLPEDIGDVWWNVTSLVLERNAQLHSLPPTYGRMNKTGSLALAFDGFETLPTDAMMGLHIFDVNLDWNPLQELPAYIGDPKIFYSVSFQHTNITEFPADWMWTYLENEWGIYFALGGGSPLCEKLIAGEWVNDVFPLGATWTDGFMFGMFIVDCVEYTTIPAYDMAKEHARRAKNLT